MASAWITVVVVTAFWGFVGIICPFFVPKSSEKGIIQTMLVLTAVCCYLFWLCTFLMQLNPLFGPELETSVLRAILWNWEGKDENFQ
ncbi:V-type proton ATPase subunit e 2 [Holothuria leucospilota]|uniref:V-type proton ATPase subunit n=1 Tax=Holothuria leucospilota TaxID=206669 RepID=A0A9Q0YQJ5_HOLLE|nr:V-type proton ATPase subunit e 2 [Holothuria leucospilota]